VAVVVLLLVVAVQVDYWLEAQPLFLLLHTQLLLAVAVLEVVLLLTVAVVLLQAL
jgi:hypothetical protein